MAKRKPPGKRRRFRNIQQSFFSEKYNKLPFRQKLSVRRKLEKDCTNLIETAEKLADSVKQLDNDFREFRRKARLFQNPDINANDLRQAKAKKYQFSQMKKTLDQQISQFTEYAEQYFNDFNPHHGFKHKSNNPMEAIVHKTYRLIGEFEIFFESLGTQFDSVQRQLIKRR